MVLLSIYAIGILLAVLMARLFSRFLVKGDDTPFVMELPPYRVPTVKTIFRHTWEKGAQYLKKMGGIIMIASILIWFLGYYPRGSYETMAEQQEHSYIGQIGKTIEPVIEPLGFDWKMSVCLITGLPAKEAIVSTMGILYPSDMALVAFTPVKAYAFMAFVLLYFPCVATITTLGKELGAKWAWFSVAHSLVLAWVVSWVINLIGSLVV